MYCGKCGAECKDGAKYCSKCGAPLQSDSLTNDTPTPLVNSENSAATETGGWFQQHKKIAWIILIVIVAAVIVIVAVSVARHSSKDADMSLEDHLDLGIRYLDDGEFEEAAEEFNAVLAIEPNMQAYRYLADAYLDLDETDLAGDVYEEAVAYALDTYDQTGELPQYTEELYDEAIVYEVHAGDVVRLNDLGELIIVLSDEDEATSEDTSASVNNDTDEPEDGPDADTDGEQADDEDQKATKLDFELAEGVRFLSEDNTVTSDEAEDMYSGAIDTANEFCDAAFNYDGENTMITTRIESMLSGIEGAYFDNANNFKLVYEATDAVFSYYSFKPSYLYICYDDEYGDIINLFGLARVHAASLKIPEDDYDVGVYLQLVQEDDVWKIYDLLCGDLYSPGEVTLHPDETYKWINRVDGDAVEIFDVNDVEGYLTDYTYDYDFDIDEG